MRSAGKGGFLGQREPCAKTWCIKSLSKEEKKIEVMLARAELIVWKATAGSLGEQNQENLALLASLLKQSFKTRFYFTTYSTYFLKGDLIF